MNRLLNALYPFALVAGLAGIAGAALAASRHHPVALAARNTEAKLSMPRTTAMVELGRNSRGNREVRFTVIKPVARISVFQESENTIGVNTCAR